MITEEQFEQSLQLHDLQLALTLITSTLEQVKPLLQASSFVDVMRQQFEPQLKQQIDEFKNKGIKPISYQIINNESHEL